MVVVVGGGMVLVVVVIEEVFVVEQLVMVIGVVVVGSEAVVVKIVVVEDKVDLITVAVVVEVVAVAKELNGDKTEGVEFNSGLVVVVVNVVVGVEIVEVVSDGEFDGGLLLGVLWCEGWLAVGEINNVVVGVALRDVIVVEECVESVELLGLE